MSGLSIGPHARATHTVRARAVGLSHAGWARVRAWDKLHPPMREVIVRVKVRVKVGVRVRAADLHPPMRKLRPVEQHWLIPKRTCHMEGSTG